MIKISNSGSAKKGAGHLRTAGTLDCRFTRGSDRSGDDMTGDPTAFQDHYPDDVAHCYGCGRLNERGHQLRSFWEGDETVAHFTPSAWHTAIPGYVYGGLRRNVGVHQYMYFHFHRAP